MSNDPAAADTQDLPSEPEDMVEFSTDKKSRVSMRTILIAIGVLIPLNLAAIIFLPPFDPGVADSAACTSLGSLSEIVNCLVNGTLHLPRPHELVVAGGAAPETGLLTFQVSLTDTLLTMLILTALVLVAMTLATRGKADVPGFFQNFAEWAHESMSNWSIGMGGSKAAKWLPIFAAFFILILVFNWSGLVPGLSFGISWFRAPTSDLNVTLGLAMFAWFYFQFQGFRALGIGGYLSKFFPFHEFKHGIGAGLIALFVGFVELILEFVKPITLSMRLFGNIYGGEVALAIVVALAGAFLIPVALYGLEIILTTIQALIFATLTLMFIIAAMESHSEEGHEEEEVLAAESIAGTDTDQGAAATA